MRMSCNGCRVLRKGCSESCVLRPCLHWISTAESQANATIFLAKFYGRAGLTNLISNGPEHLRPAIFRSLLYEACGRIVNPINGSLGLLCTGNWALCQAGVESILQGSFSAVIGDNSSSHILRMEAMTSRELHRSVKIRGKLKGPSHTKARRSERGRAPSSNHMDSSCKSHDDWCYVTETLQKAAENSKFAEKCMERNSSLLLGKEVDKFIDTDPAQMEYCHDLCNLKTRQTEAEAPCDEVGLELTLGCQDFFPRTPHKSVAHDLRCSDAYWDQCTENNLHK